MVSRTPLTREQEKALFAQSAKTTDKAREQLLGSLTKGVTPTFREKSAFRREFEKLREGSKEKQALKDLEKKRKIAEEAQRTKVKAEQDELLRKQIDLRHQFADKKITFEEFQERLRKIIPKVEAESGGLLPLSQSAIDERRKQEEIIQKEKADEMKVIQKEEREQERYYEESRRPISIMPSGTQKARRDPKTGRLTSRLTSSEARRLGEVVTETGGEPEEVLSPSESVKTGQEGKSPTVKSEREKRESEKKETERSKSAVKPSDTSNISASERLALVLSGAEE